MNNCYNTKNKNIYKSVQERRMYGPAQKASNKELEIPNTISRVIIYWYPSPL
jgi:hypothetical protein